MSAFAKLPIMASVVFKKFLARIMLQLKVYFGSLEVMNIIESPEYNFDSLLTNLGGALSLCLGVSFIMVFEIIELIIRGIEVLIISALGGRQRHSTSSVPTKKG